MASPGSQVNAIRVILNCCYKTPLLLLEHEPYGEPVYASQRRNILPGVVDQHVTDFDASTEPELHEAVESIVIRIYFILDIALSKKNPSSAFQAIDAMREIGFFFGGMIGVESLSRLAEAHYIAGDLKEAIAVHKELLHLYGGHSVATRDIFVII